MGLMYSLYHVYTYCMSYILIYVLHSLHFIYSNLNRINVLLYIVWCSYITQMKMFSDLVLSDFPNNRLRFLAIYNVLSPLYNRRFLLKNLVPKNRVTKTVTNLFMCSSWFEREGWDLFGVFFAFNLDLRRLLNDYGFDGHPLRKDFPISGFVEVSYCQTLGTVLYDRVRLGQAFRFFSTNLNLKYYF